MIYYERDADGAFLIVMTAPEVEKGNGYLRLGDNMWMYPPQYPEFSAY
jgi:hypothetical protein